jgi:hypothetical protein
MVLGSPTRMFAGAEAGLFASNLYCSVVGTLTWGERSWRLTLDWWLRGSCLPVRSLLNRDRCLRDCSLRDRCPRDRSPRNRWLRDCGLRDRWLRDCSRFRSGNRCFHLYRRLRGQAPGMILPQSLHDRRCHSPLSVPREVACPEVVHELHTHQVHCAIHLHCKFPAALILRTLVCMVRRKISVGLISTNVVCMVRASFRQDPSGVSGLCGP